jgi:hypothetical protein
MRRFLFGENFVITKAENVPIGKDEDYAKNKIMDNFKYPNIYTDRLWH